MPSGKGDDGGNEGGDQPQRHDDHLQELRPGDGLDAARGRVQDDDAADEHAGNAVGQAENDRERDGLGMDRDADGKTPLDQEEQRHQGRASSRRTAVRGFVRRENAGFQKPRQEDGGK